MSTWWWLEDPKQAAIEVRDPRTGAQETRRCPSCQGMALYWQVPFGKASEVVRDTLLNERVRRQLPNDCHVYVVELVESEKGSQGRAQGRVIDLRKTNDPGIRVDPPNSGDFGEILAQFAHAPVCPRLAGPAIKQP